MRVAIGIHGTNFHNVRKTYNSISSKFYTHATPTLFNASTTHSQLASCFLLDIDDSIEGIFKTYTDCGLISKWAGGLGVHISNIRSHGSYIRKTGGTSDGVMPLLKTFNCIARQFNQSGKRNGSFAMYMEVHHADIFTFLDAKKNHGADEERARDLFYALWVCDLFMEMVEQNGDWYLMNPDECRGLNEVYGNEYVELYMRYVDEGKYVKKIKARDLWEAIISSQVETGMPYISYKDHVNRKSNQKNIGIVKSSNLCNEVVLVSNSEESSVCNLASICLPSILETPSYEDFFKNIKWYKLLTDEEKALYKWYTDGDLKIYTTNDCSYCKLLKQLLTELGLDFTEIDAEQAEKYRIMSNQSLSVVKPFETVPQLFSLSKGDVMHLGGYDDSWALFKPRINYEHLVEIAAELVVNLNKVIDVTYYPTERTRNSNLRHRPLGIGVQGLADLFFMLKLPFDSDEARDINKKIFEAMYFGAMVASYNLALEHGPYSSFRGSPLSEGYFQFNLWGLDDEDLSGRWKWDELRQKIMKSGVRNSMLIALMPTASTSQIQGFNECFEPITSNIYTRRTLAGEFTVINKYLIKDLITLDLWNDETKDFLLYTKGSVQKMNQLPKFLKNVYKTVWEISQKNLITMSAERGPFVCQSQSLNLFFDKPDFKTLTNAHFHGWKSGLKTGSYYIRSKPAMNAQSFGLSIEKESKMKENENDDDDICLTCSA
jgi:ribonucleoside-diphosphate reductase alpha subunit